MRLEPIFEMELDYAGGFFVIAPYGGTEGAGYGSGEGHVSGERLSGSVRWSNHPRRREDGVLLPDAHGVIETDDGARIVFHLGGYSTVIDGEPAKRSILSPATFATDDDRYRWLNDVVAVGEGIIDFRTLRLRLRYYAVVNEMA
ncbi:MAG TPA: DUF3237 family protein [Solirubrobacteraceae bacterium]|nr:DUF3237 family protein [Solirubrobacteraceae bacterium]